MVAGLCAGVRDGADGAETVGGADLDGDAEQRFPRIERRLDAPFTRFGDDDARGIITRTSAVMKNPPKKK